MTIANKYIKTRQQLKFSPETENQKCRLVLLVIIILQQYLLVSSTLKDPDQIAPSTMEAPLLHMIYIRSLVSLHLKQIASVEIMVNGAEGLTEVVGEGVAEVNHKTQKGPVYQEMDNRYSCYYLYYLKLT
jgi:hypothetical protein